jgi:hypothetical protein
LLNLGALVYGSQDTNDTGLPAVGLVVSKERDGLSMDVNVAGGTMSLEQVTLPGSQEQGNSDARNGEGFSSPYHNTQEMID